MDPIFQEELDPDLILRDPEEEKEIDADRSLPEDEDTSERDSILEDMLPTE